MKSSIIVPFTMTLIIRFIGVILQTVAPIFVIQSLQIQSYVVGILISVLWVCNGLGAIAAFSIRRINVIIPSGFVILSIALFIFSISPRDLPVFIIIFALAGTGMGIIQPLLAPIMHSNSSKGSRYSGIGFYSFALSIGLILGTFVSSLFTFFSSISMIFLIAFLCSVFLFVFSIKKRVGIIPLDIGGFKNIFNVVKSGLFAKSYWLNMLYSLLLPVILSYSAIFALKRFGLSAPYMLTLLGSMFVISSILRLLSTRLKVSYLGSIMIIPSLFLLASFVIISLTNSIMWFIVGILLFSVPHALIYPWTTFNAFQSVGKEKTVIVNYIFSTSSGLAEFISPPSAALIIARYGLNSLFPSMIPICILVMAWVIVFFVLPRNSIKV